MHMDSPLSANARVFLPLLYLGGPFAELPNLQSRATLSQSKQLMGDEATE